MRTVEQEETYFQDFGQMADTIEYIIGLGGARRHITLTTVHEHRSRNGVPSIRPSGSEVWADGEWDEQSAPDNLYRPGRLLAAESTVELGTGEDRFDADADITFGGLVLRWYSSDVRDHSLDIIHPPEFNKGIAHVSGNMSETHPVSSKVIGISWGGTARMITDPQEVRKIYDRWLKIGLFTEIELKEYDHGKPNAPQHRIFEATPYWIKVVDATNEDDNTPRYILFSVDGEASHCGLPSDSTIHEERYVHRHHPLRQAA